MKVPVDRAAPEVMTPGTGLEWTPVVTGDGGAIAFIGATAQRPPLVATMPVNGGATRWIGEERLPADFPTARLVVPKKVVYRAPDGVEVHAQLFDAASDSPHHSGTLPRPAAFREAGGSLKAILPVTD